jgi:hypothetical protein
MQAMSKSNEMKASVQETSLQETSVQEPNLQETSVQEPSLQETSVQEPSLQETSVQEPSVQKAWIFVDNSNLFLSAQWEFQYHINHSDGKVSDVTKSTLDSLRIKHEDRNIQIRRDTYEKSSIWIRNNNIRVNFKEILQLLETGGKVPLQIMGRSCVGSVGSLGNLRDNDDWVKHFEACGYITSFRSLDGKDRKEHGVDGDLKAWLLAVAAEHILDSHNKQSNPKVKPIIVLATGDGNNDLGPISFPKVVEIVIKLGFRVQIWGWKIGMSIKFYELSMLYPSDLTVHLFDNFTQSGKLTFCKETPIGSIGSIGSIASIVPMTSPPGFHQFGTVMQSCESSPPPLSESRFSSPYLTPSASRSISRSPPPLSGYRNSSPCLTPSSSPCLTTYSSRSLSRSLSRSPPPIKLAAEPKLGCQRITIRNKPQDVCEQWIKFCGATKEDKQAFKCTHHNRDDSNYPHLDTPICVFWITNKGSCPKPSCAYHHPVELGA